MLLAIKIILWFSWYRWAKCVIFDSIVLDNNKYRISVMDLVAFCYGFILPIKVNRNMGSWYTWLSILRDYTWLWFIPFSPFMFNKHGCSLGYPIPFMCKVSKALLDSVFLKLWENSAWSSDGFTFGNRDLMFYIIHITFSSFVLGSLTMPLSPSFWKYNHKVKL